MPRSSSYNNGGSNTLNSKSKKSFATRLANQIDKLTGGGTLRANNNNSQARPALQDVFRDPHSGQAHLTTPRRRAFRNVVPGKGRVYIAPPHHPTNSPPPYNYYNPWDQNRVSAHNHHHYVHPSRCANLDEAPLRRAQSDESISIVREGKNRSTWYDLEEEEEEEVEVDSGEDFAYAEVDYIYSFGPRRPPPQQRYYHNTPPHKYHHHRNHSAHAPSRASRRPEDHHYHHQHQQQQHYGRRRSPDVKMIRQSQAVVVMDQATIQKPPRHISRSRQRSGENSHNCFKKSQTVPSELNMPQSNSKKGRSVIYVGQKNSNSNSRVSTPRKTSSASSSGGGLTIPRVATSNKSSLDKIVSNKQHQHQIKRPSGGSSGSEPFTEDDDDDDSTTADEDDPVETSRKDSLTDDDDFEDDDDDDVPRTRQESLSPKIVPPPRLVKLRKMQKQKDDEFACIAQIDKALEDDNSDYDADISQQDSPKKTPSAVPPSRYLDPIQRRSAVRQVLSQDSIPEEEDEDDEGSNANSRSRSGSTTSSSRLVRRRRSNIDRSRLGKLLIGEQQQQSTGQMTKSEPLEQRRRRMLSRSDNSLLEEKDEDEKDNDDTVISRGFSSEVLKELYSNKDKGRKRNILCVLYFL